MGLAIGKNEVNVPFTFTCYDGSGATKVPLDLTNLASGVLRPTGKQDIALDVIDAVGGVVSAIVNGTDFADDSSTLSQCILTFLDGSIRDSRTFNIVQSSPITVTP